MLNKMFFWLSGFLRCKIINGEDGQPYLERYMLLRYKEHVVFLHRFLDSDSDRGIHDHPWDQSFSFILAGGYNEKRLVVNSKTNKEEVIIRDIRPMSVNNIKGNDFHQILLKPRVPAWTIFYHAKRTKTWGFQCYNLFNNTNEINKLSYEVYDDKTNPKDHWEKYSALGRDSKRTSPEYILNKNLT